jgi:methionyl-tRNA formyltransferase
MTRIVFMGSPALAVPSLAALAEAAPRHGARIVGVFAQPDRRVGRHSAAVPCPVSAAAQSLGLPVFTPAKLRSAEGTAALRDLAPQLAIVCAYGQILTQPLLNLPALGCFNLHFSLLPRWRGASPLQAAIFAGDAVTGVSLQRMVLELDAGPLVAESDPAAIGPDDTAETLGWRLADVSAAVLRRALPGLLSGNPPTTPQDPARITTCRTLRKEDGAIDWTRETAEAIARKVRAYTPWPGCHAFLGARRLGLVRVAVASDEEAAPYAAQPVPAGTILPGGVIATASGCVRLLGVKPEGKAAMAWDDFTRGTPSAVGARLTPRPAPA